MSCCQYWTRTITAALVLTSTPHALPARRRTFTGEVGDATCGRKHMEGTSADCTRNCVAHGSKYGLIIGEKIYILETGNKAALAMLDKLAGKNVTVTGTLEGETITSVRWREVKEVAFCSGKRNSP